MKKRIVFMGTPAFPVPILEALINESDYEVVGVVTQPDKRVGREGKIQYTPIKEVALKHNIKVLQPEKIRTDYQDIMDLNPDIIITAAYGQIVPKVLLDFPKYGCINVHGSLLPKLRGGAPIHKAILYGEKETGVTIMYMAPKMDAGDMIAKQSFPILDSDTVGTVHDKMQIVGKDLLLKTLPNIFSGNINPEKQDESLVTYAWNISREEEKLDFNKTAREVFNHIRAFNPWPVAFTTINNKILKVLASEYVEANVKGTNGEVVKYNNRLGIKVSNGIIFLKEVKPEGKKVMDFNSYLNGNKAEFQEGTILG